MSKYNFANKKSSNLNYPSIRPSLYLNFIASQKVPSFVNVTRNSQTTYVDKFGILRTADINQPVFEWDPITGKCLGARIWGSVTNQRIQSEAFIDIAAGGAWSFLGGDTATQNQALSPANTLTADFIAEGTTSGSGHGVGQNHSFVSGLTYTTSVFAKEFTGAKRYVSMIFYPGAFGSFKTAIVDVSTGESFSVSSGVTVGSELHANGFRRIWATCAATATATAEVHIRITSSKTDTSGNQLGNPGNGMYLWGAQLNPGLIAPYVPTTTAAVSSTADIWNIAGNDFNRIYNQNEGTILSEFVTLNTDLSRGIGVFYSSIDNRISLRAASTTMVSNRIEQFSLSITPPQTNIISKLALSFNANGATIFNSNGNELLTPSLSNIPTGINTLQLGTVLNQSELYLNGYIRTLAYWPKRLTNAQLQLLTR